VAKLIDFSETKENCVGWQGALEGMLELTKTKGTVKEVKCLCEGGDCCEFEIKWE
jgi:predicted hydrocarbon binding protein